MILRAEWIELARQWAAHRIEAAIGATLPPHRVGVGFPGTGRRGKRIGECWPSSATEDGVREVIVSPVLTGNEVVSTLLHELIHVALEDDVKHGPSFKQLALAVGFEGPMRSTPTGAALAADITQWVEATGPYPAEPLNAGHSPRKKQGTRLIKCKCQSCGYVARTTRKWLEEAGPPLCPCNQSPMLTHA